MINILDKLRDELVLTEYLTPKQIELEKKQFLEAINIEDNNRIKRLIIRMSEQNCHQRLNGKNHYISDVCFSQSAKFSDYERVQIFCAFCGQIDFLLCGTNYYNVDAEDVKNE